VNWEAIGAVGEIIGALAVIATLGYLAVQIRENARSTTTSIYESAMDGYIELNRVMLEADIGAVYFKSLKDPESLSEFEQFRFNNLHRMWLAHVYKLFRLYERGVLPKDEWVTTVMDAVMLSDTKLHMQFRKDNPFFNDLYVEIDKYKSNAAESDTDEAAS
jgi:hypothetical protein